jgi:hypothetical protein
MANGLAGARALYSHRGDRVITHAKRNILEVTVFLHAPSAPWRIEVEVLEEGERIAIAEDQTAVATGRLDLAIPYAQTLVT